MKSVKTVLGIVFYKNSIAVSQIHSSGRDTVRQKPAEFVLGAEQAQTGDLAVHAARFKDFLKTHHFSSTKAVVGLDAGRLFSTLLTIPAVKDEAASDDIIRIQLERGMQLDMEEVVFSYVRSGEKVFAAAVLKKHLEQIKSFLLVSGIRVISVTAACLALERQIEAKAGCTVLEYPRSAELLLTQGGQVVGLREISGGSDMTALLPHVYREINRFGLTQREPVRCQFTLSGSTAAGAGDAIRRQFDRVDIRPLAGASVPSDLPGAYAQAMAERCIAGTLPALNFLAAAQPHRSRAHKSGWIKRAAAAAAIVIAAALLFALEWQLDRHKISNYQQQLGSISESVKAAEIMIDQAAYARRWYSPRPVYLELLAELTRCFPESGSIWLNSLAADETLNQVMTGKASGEQAVLDVVDNLKASPFFRDIKILYIRQAGKNTREETFAISFCFVPEN